MGGNLTVRTARPCRINFTLLWQNVNILPIAVAKFYHSVY